MDIKITVEVSARHCHLSKKDAELLFGKGHKLKKIKQLGQPSDFAAEETIDIQAGDRIINNVRVVGPEREATQVEISRTDAMALGINPPVRLSGDLNDSSPVKLIGPVGQVDLEKGVIVALRHIHCTKAEADKIGLKNMDAVSVEIKSERPLVFHDVLVRVRNDYKLCMHIDTDEANAAGIDREGQGQIL